MRVGLDEGGWEAVRMVFWTIVEVTVTEDCGGDKVLEGVMIFSGNDDGEEERLGVNGVITVSADGLEEDEEETLGVTNGADTESDLGDWRYREVEEIWGEGVSEDFGDGGFVGATSEEGGGSVEVRASGGRAAFLCLDRGEG